MADVAVTPIVAVPGTLCDARVFGPMLGPLGHQLLPVNRIAHATVGEAAAARLIDAPDRFVAVGFSLGGFVVLDMMRRCPERLAGVVLVASNALPLLGAAADRRRDLDTIRREGSIALIDQLWPRYVAPAHADRADIRGLIDAMAADTPHEAFAAQIEMAISRPDSRDLLAATDVPVLILDGELDRMSPPPGSGGPPPSPSVRRTVLGGVGHFVPLEAPDAARAAVTTFVRDLV